MTSTNAVRKTLLVAVAGLALLAFSATAVGSTPPPVPLSAQKNIRAAAGAEAYVPTRLVSGGHYRFRIWSYTKSTKTLHIRFADLRFALGTHPLYFTVAPFTQPISRCVVGNKKEYQYDGNRVYANGQEAWRCIAGPRGTVKVIATGPHLPDVAWARVVASTHRIY